MNLLHSLVAACLAVYASAETVSQITGTKYQSPLNGQNVTNVGGLVTAVGPNGFWIRSTTPDRDDRTSESVYVFGRSSVSQVKRGDIITLNGRVLEFRNNNAYLFLTEIERPSNITVISSNNTIEPVVLGRRGLNPPNRQYIGLDNGDVFAVPNNQSQVSSVNPTLEPKRYGMDFWESLSGELVTVRDAVATGKADQFRETFIVGDWPVSGRNRRGALTISDRDGNPEIIEVGSALDGTRNPENTLIGAKLGDITGVIQYAFGGYQILPLTAIKIQSTPQPALPPPTDIVSRGKCNGISMADYNVENFFPSDTAHVNEVAGHIVNYLKSPDLIFLQEIQDNNGPTNDAVVSANQTLATLISAITAAGSPVQYAFIDLPPVDDQDGGQPGGNIRVAYLYNPSILALTPNSVPGSSTDVNTVEPGPKLKYNPGRVDPLNPAWEATRKPLAAQWRVIADKSDAEFFTINNHWSSKGGSTNLQGDQRPPVNGGVEKRNEQAKSVANFVKQILDRDRDASVVVAGDLNEFSFVQPIETFKRISGLREADEVVGIREEERYTYVFQGNCQQLDHVFVSRRAARGLKFEHVHVNTWVDYDSQVSDHDPSVFLVDVCQARRPGPPKYGPKL